jgi:hypothetical protein
MKQEIAKDRSCVSSKPTAVKVVFMIIVGTHLKNNTPLPLEGEDSHSFVRRQAQRDVSTYQTINGNRKMPAKKKRKSRSVGNTHERDLENKKWNKDAEAALVSDIGKDLPKNPNDDTEEQSEAREFLEEYKSSKQAVANNRLMETEVKKTEQALRKGMQSFQGSYCNRKRQCVLQL